MTKFPHKELFLNSSTSKTPVPSPHTIHLTPDTLHATSFQTLSISNTNMHTHSTFFFHAPIPSVLPLLTNTYAHTAQWKLPPIHPALADMNASTHTCEKRETPRVTILNSLRKKRVGSKSSSAGRTNSCFECVFVFLLLLSLTQSTFRSHAHLRFGPQTLSSPTSFPCTFALSLAR